MKILQSLISKYKIPHISYLKRLTDLNLSKNIKMKYLKYHITKYFLPRIMFLCGNYLTLSVRILSNVTLTFALRLNSAITA